MKIIPIITILVKTVLVITILGVVLVVTEISTFFILLIAMIRVGLFVAVGVDMGILLLTLLECSVCFNTTIQASSSF
jgi:hypothetical protein